MCSRCGLGSLHGESYLLDSTPKDTPPLGLSAEAPVLGWIDPTPFQIAPDPASIVPISFGVGDPMARDDGLTLAQPLSSIAWGTAQDDNNVTFFFTPPGNTYGGYNSTTFTQVEKNAFYSTFADIATFTNLTFTEVGSVGAADFKLVSTAMEGTVLGRMKAPDTTDEGFGWFNYNGRGWNYNDANGGLQKGGYGYVTAVHEIGHGLGLAHPHDTGGSSTVMTGVASSSDAGTNRLNQSVFTIMSYNDGWIDSGFGVSPSNNYGWMATFGALDMAVLQRMYGYNWSHASGNNVYTLPDANANGTFYACIWDGGGTDEIRYDGTRNATIDLRAATLQDAAGGGGYVSNANGIHGGFTIANLVNIENATGGSGNDTLTGNEFSNTLTGRAGADALNGGGGFDMASYAGSNAAVTVDLQTGKIMGGHAEGDTYVSIEDLGGSSFGDSLAGNDGSNMLRGEGGDDSLYGRGGFDIINGGAGNDVISGGAGGDAIDGGNDFDTMTYGDAVISINLATGVHTGEAAGDTYAGIERFALTAGADTFVGNGSNNDIQGGAGADSINGGDGFDAVTYLDSNTGVNVQLSLGKASGGTAEGDTLVSIEDVNGSNHGDTIGGTTGSNQLMGYGGNDSLTGAGGFDILNGGTGDDVIYLDGTGGDWADGGADNDTLVFVGGAVSVDLATNTFGGAAAGMIVAGIENVVGSDQGDTLRGNGLGQRLAGGGGADTLRGEGGADVIEGGAGVDQMFGGTGDDTIWFDPADAVIDAGTGFDTARATTNDGLAIRMDAWNVEQLFAGGGHDVIFTFGTAAYNVDGGAGNDSISGNVFGDVLGGNVGNDVIDGGAGNDTLGGGVGSDRLLGGIGADTLFGEADPDSYVYRGLIDAGDTIIGFETAALRGGNGDKLEIQRAGFMDLSQWNAGALDANRFVAGAATLATGQFLFDTNTGNLFWDGDGTGAGFAQLLLNVQGVNNLTAADFVLV